MNCEKCLKYEMKCKLLMVEKCTGYQPKEKPMENKVIFGSEEEFDDFYANCGRNTVGDYDYKVMKEKVIAKGYIRKSPVEEAEEYIRHVEKIMDGMTTPSPKDLEYSIRIVEKLKSEIERLKN